MSAEVIDRDQVGNGHGRLPDAAVMCMEREVKRWLALKYGFLCVDGDNQAVYEVHPLDWAPGDLDFVYRWNEFLLSPSRPSFKARELVMEGRERGVNTVPLHVYFPLPRKKIPWPLKAGAAVGAFFLGRWLLSPPSAALPKGTPTVDVDPIENALREAAGLKPRPKDEPKLESPNYNEEPEET